jgi:DNA-directed RNA polymerase subunit K/omega
MVTRPVNLGSYEFVVVCALRAQQLRAGSVPRAAGDHSATTMAQMEVAGGHVSRAAAGDPTAPVQCGWQL